MPSEPLVPMTVPSTPRAIDLFAGCGGLTLGLKEAGFSVIGGVEKDPVSAETYRLNHPEVRLWTRDIRRLSVKEVKNELDIGDGELEVLAGCPPCQGFSTMRTRNRGTSVDDPRNDLIDDFLRFVRVLRPQTVMMENVPGLARDSRMVTFRDRVERLGYDVEIRVLRAERFGLPQRRKRLIFFAGRHGKVGLPTENDQASTVRDAIGSAPVAGGSGDPLHDMPERRSVRVMRLIRAIPKDGGSRVSLSEDQQLECHKGFNGFKDVYGRMAWDDIAPTITGGCYNPSKGRFLHPSEDRAITLREAAVLQGFPWSYSFPSQVGKIEVARMVGNAFPPPWMKALGSTVLSYLEQAR